MTLLQRLSMVISLQFSSIMQKSLSLDLILDLEYNLNALSLLMLINRYSEAHKLDQASI